MRALKFITGHVIHNQAYTYKIQLRTTIIQLLNSRPAEITAFRLESKYCKGFFFDK